MSRALLDTVREIETPEGVELAVRVAGPLPRALAWLVDVTLRSMMYGALGAPMAMLGEAGMGLILIMMFVGEWFYPVLFEVLWDGQTPGKRVMGLAVVHDDGTPVDWPASALRNLVRFADFMPVMYGFGLASCLLSRDFKRLGDLAANTLVVYRADGGRERSLAEAPATPPPVPLRLDEQRALLDFSSRHTTWSAARSEELADHLAPLTGLRGREGVQALLGIARWLSGRR